MFKSLIRDLLRKPGAFPHGKLAAGSPPGSGTAGGTYDIRGGIELQKQGLAVEAEACFRRALAADPGNLEALRLLGNLLQRQAQAGAAVRIFERAEKLAPGDPLTHFQLAGACYANGEHQRALQHYRMAIELDRSFATAFSNLGNVLRELGQPQAAIDAYRRAAELRPDLAAAHHNLGNALFSDGRDYGQVLQCYERALQLQPDFAEGHFSFGLALLASGDFARGWNEFGWRFSAGRGERRLVALDLPQPEWRGEDLTGKSLLIWGEQGIGDQIQFAGLIPELIERARRCALLCAPKLAVLFARSFPAAEIRTEISQADLHQGFDYQVAAGNAARWLRPSLASFPNRSGYLTVDPQRRAYWRTRIAGLGRGPKVGFSWRSTDLRGERALACPQITDWDPLFALPEINWICLQYDECRRELDYARQRCRASLHHFAEVDMFNDLHETAALMSALDIVVSAPTTVSVLAGALGVETWQLTYGGDWQTHGTPHNPWYPSMRRYVRGWQQPWCAVTTAVAGELQGWVRRHS